MTYIERLPDDAELFFQMNDYKGYTAASYVGYIVRPSIDIDIANNFLGFNLGPFLYEDNVYHPVQYCALIDEFSIVIASALNFAAGSATYDYEAIDVPHHDKIKHQRHASMIVKLSTNDPNRWYIYDHTLHTVTKSGNTYHCDNNLSIYIPEADFAKIFNFIKEPIIDRKSVV